MYEIMTEDQKEYTKMVCDVLTKELVPILEEYEKKSQFPMSVHDKLGEMGFHGLAVPEEYGGCGFDFETQYLIEEEMGKIDAGFAFSYCVGKATAGTVLKYGTEEQKHKVCDFLVNGGIGASALTEADAGSDVTNIRTTAVRDGDDYIINGTKCFISNAPQAGLFQVLAYTDKEKRGKGMSFFLVEKERGVQVGKHEDKMGLRLSETCEIVLDNVRVPAKNRIGEEGEGYRLALGQVGKARLMSSAAAIGLAQRALDEAVAYAKVRTQFGKPIASFQGVSFLLADMEIKIQAARQLALYTARVAQTGADYVLPASCTKTFATDMAMQVASDAIQVLGGYGYSKEYPVEKLLRDAKVFQIFEGTNQIQRMIIGGILAK